MPIDTRPEQKDPGNGDSKDPIQAAVDYGIDVAQLRDNVTLTVTERLRRHQMALNVVETLQRAKRP